jgi:protein-S-isoprenylcysteine O-methyltransferase Ste14
MLAVEIIRDLSFVFLVGLFVAFGMLGFFGRKRRDLGSAKASSQSDFVLLYHVWHVLIFPFPLVFFLVGVIMPSWVYGTILNLSFQGGEYLQVLSLPLLLISVTLCGWSAHVLGQFMDTHIQVLQKHELVTRGPYSRIRHPAYTSAIIIALASTLLFFNLIMFLAFVAILAIAYKRAVLEEELLASEDGFGQDYRDYMKKTGRFLPRL